MTTSSKRLRPSARLTPSEVSDILWESAVEAFVQAILVLIMGRIALDIVGGLFHDMIPSVPPGLAGMLGVEAESSPNSHHWWSPFSKHQFPIVFALLFVLQAAGQLFGRSRTGTRSKTVSHLQKIGQQLSEDWFSLIVANAFVAMVSAMVLAWVQKFSLNQILWHWFLDSVLPSVHNFADQVLGAARTDAIGKLFAWYGDNQLKFNFWFIYLASICDDLGLPNLKTLARFLWRRNRKRKRPAPPSPATEQIV
jgi:hypothetical protein